METLVLDICFDAYIVQYCTQDNNIPFVNCSYNYVPLPKNVSAATTYPSTPHINVGCMTGAKKGL